MSWGELAAELAALGPPEDGRWKEDQRRQEELLDDPDDRPGDDPREELHALLRRDAAEPGAIELESEAWRLDT